MANHVFECGCSLRILEEFPDGRPPSLDFDFEEIPEDCPEVAKLLAQGQTVGIFQLEKSLGKKWTKRLRPETVEHLSALVALLRPGCLNAEDENGISITDHYCMRKNGEEETKGIHPAYDPIMKDTYGVQVYQENLMFLSRELAGFDVGQMDRLRKNVGKKDMKGLSEVKDLFLEGCKKTGLIPDELAKQIWGWIVEAGRYLFAKAHAYSYGWRAYQTAWLKVHFPHLFYSTWLETAHQKADDKDEMRFLIDDARARDIDVHGPSVLQPAAHFFREGDSVRFGLADVGGIGEKSLEPFYERVKGCEEKLRKTLKEFSLLEIIFFFVVELNKTTAVALITAGAFAHWKLPRKTLLHLYDALSKLTKIELAHCQKAIHGPKEVKQGQLWGESETGGSSVPVLRIVSKLLRACARPKKDGGGCYNKDRCELVLGLASLVDNPPSSIQDSAGWIAQVEEQLLGVALSCTRADDCESPVDGTCKEFASVPAGSFFTLAVEVKNVKEILTKRGENPGQKMAFVQIADSSGAMESVCFPTEYKKFGAYLRPNNVVVVRVEKDRKQGGAIIKGVWQG